MTQKQISLVVLQKNFIYKQEVELLPYRNENEQTITTCSNMDDSHKHTFE